ncbi:hypothetical protein GCM10010156_66240 [Planobispora rosea]|uniref:Uncharacterized protein n=1 Tax=Planobispora rosea TaxID=35762 RepID=A0A8J3SDZ0_PLARO|nr:hypothetical protein [Planobispora rosea]GGS98860.1 hypothetical protein GCM10010156_66240 [Planobispora rosea]GIH87988.1 hypothetical protein Pro02_63960 [Planobispora rosea]
MTLLTTCPGAGTVSSAERVAHELAGLLAAEHGVHDVDVHLLASGNALLSVFAGLVVRTNGHHIWWTVPTAASPGRTRPLLVFTLTVRAAAERLAKHRAVLVRADVVKRIREGTAGHIADSYVEALTHDDAAL